MARPSLLTPELQAKLCELVAGGLPVSVACDHEGIHYSTVKRWMQREDGNYPEFCASMKRARAQSQKTMVDEIREGVKDWQARAWYLERSDP